MEQKVGKSHYIWTLIKYKPFLYMCTTLLNLLIGVMPLIEGMIIKEFFDIIGGKDSFIFNPYELIGLIAILAIVHVLLIRIYFRKSSLHNFYISTLLRGNMLRSILKKHGAKSINSSIGEAINSFRDDVSQIETSIFWLSTLIGQIISASVAVIILLFINVKITLLIFVPLVVIIRLAQKSEKNIEEHREKEREATGAVNGAVGEIFESILAIKVSGSKKELMNNLKPLNEKRHKEMIKDSMLSQIIDSIYSNVINIGTGVILLLGAGAISKGSFTVGDFSVFVYYLVFITDAVESLGNFIVYFKQTKVGHRNILNQIGMEEGSEDLVKHKCFYLDKGNKEDIYKEKEFEKLELGKELKILEVKGVTYLYDKSRNGIKDINFSLKKGEILVISGRTGSGKSTLLKALIGLLPKSEGKIYWNGEVVENEKEFFVPPISAYTPQVPNLFSDTLKNNILLGLSEKDIDLGKAIGSSVFEKDLKELDNGFDTEIGAKATKLSGGQIQRVAAARMFVRNPQLLVFDDVSSALDVDTESLLWSRLFNNKVSCIIVSNKRVVLEKADKVIVLKDGVVESNGTLKEVLDMSGELEEIFKEA